MSINCPFTPTRDEFDQNLPSPRALSIPDTPRFHLLHMKAWEDGLKPEPDILPQSLCNKPPDEVYKPNRDHLVVPRPNENVPNTNRSHVQAAYGRLWQRNYWAVEIGALFLAVLTLVVMVVVLRCYDHRLVADWHAPLTLNAFLSLAVTFLYIILLEVLGKSISQLRWLHFHQGRPLSDFQHYDSASRNVFTNLRVLLRLSQSWLMKLGSICFILVTAVGPFVQQVLDITIEYVPISKNATIPIARQISMSILSTDDRAACTIDRAIFSGAFAGKDYDLKIRTQCESGNCTWNDNSYATFIVRSSVTNRTADLIYADQQQIDKWLHNTTAAHLAVRDDASETERQKLVALSTDTQPHLGLTVEKLRKVASSWGTGPPGGQFLYNSTTGTATSIPYYSHFHILLMQPHPPVTTNNSVGIGDISVYFLDTRINGTANGDGLDNVTITYGPSAAWHIGFDVVLQPFTADQTGSHLAETPNGDPVARQPTPQCEVVPRGDVVNDPLFNCVSALNYTWNEQHYSLKSSTMSMLQSIFSSDFDGNLHGLPVFNYTWITPNGTNIFNVRPAANGYGELYDAVYWPISDAVTNVADPSYPAPNITLESAMGNVAKSLTAYIRRIDGGKAYGTEYNARTVFQVTWEWIIVPAVLVLMTSTMLGATIWETSRRDLPAWTDSTLAMMIHGVDDSVREELRPYRRADDLEQHSRGIMVQLSSYGPALARIKEK